MKNYLELNESEVRRLLDFIERERPGVPDGPATKELRSFLNSPKLLTMDSFSVHRMYDFIQRCALPVCYPGGVGPVTSKLEEFILKKKRTEALKAQIAQLQKELESLG